MRLYRAPKFMSLMCDIRLAFAAIVRYPGMIQDPIPPNENETDPAPNGRLSLKEILLSLLMAVNLRKVRRLA